MLINVADIPYDCVEACPEDTHESQGKCYKYQNYVQVAYSEKHYVGDNPDYYNSYYKDIFDYIRFPQRNEFSMTFWVKFDYNTNYQTVLRLTDYIEHSSSGHRSRILWVRWYGHTSYKYLYFYFADARDNSFSIYTPKKLIDYGIYYFVGVTVNYESGKYWAYVYKDGEKIYGKAFTRSNPKLPHETNWGFDKDSTYI